MPLHEVLTKRLHFALLLGFAYFPVAWVLKRRGTSLSQELGGTAEFQQAELAAAGIESPLWKVLLRLLIGLAPALSGPFAAFLTALFE